MGRLEKKSGSERLIAYAALKRFGTPEEIAELLAFCASSKPGYPHPASTSCAAAAPGRTHAEGMLALAPGA